MKKPWTIAIDGPAGAGKSTVARLLAKRLGYLYIDSGAMYRAVALNAHRQGLPSDDADAIAALARATPIRFEPDDSGGEQHAFLDGEDVTAAIRTPDIASMASEVSTIPGVRAALVVQQKKMGASGGVVMEGRDIGTVVFPQAEVKVFLTASPEERAKRRHQDLQQRGVTTATLEGVRADQDERDRRDATRSVSPLAAAPDAVQLSSDGIPAEQIVDAIEEIIDARRRGQEP